MVICTSQVALYEFRKILKEKKERGDLTAEQFKRIIFISKPYFSKVFRIIDDYKLPGFKKGKDTNYLEICKKYKMDIQKNGWDARHLYCVINYLRCFGGTSRPRVITADAKFGKIIAKEGYDIINPEKVTIANCRLIMTNNS